MFKVLRILWTQWMQHRGAARESQRLFWQAFLPRHRRSATRSTTQVGLKGSQWFPLQVEPGNAAFTGRECGKHYRIQISYLIEIPSGNATHLAKLSMGRSAWVHISCPMFSPLEAIYAIDTRLHHLCPLWCVLLSRYPSAQPVQPP